ncbi:DUF6173 family protein [Nitrospina gracilis]|uniref:DUF6173 family protein n=1 Tax=Nitrospina gracilis TaxID=35801 RepID=UPI001F1EF50A|nr:DUF6173 family protein [Nitrospina gracilis]MCF8719142.1 hypothetical protein [Nitrospina gracilis Nb-211]
MPEDESQSLVPPNQVPTECDVPAPGMPGSAECMFKKLMAHIADFEKRLTPEQEVGAMFVNFGNQSLYINGLGFHGNDMILFYGMSDKGEPVKILQHVSQTNVLLTVKKRYRKHEKPKRIGFVSDDMERIGPQKTSLDEPEEGSGASG